MDGSEGGGEAKAGASGAGDVGSDAAGGGEAAIAGSADAGGDGGDDAPAMYTAQPPPDCTTPPVFR